MKSEILVKVQKINNMFVSKFDQEQKGVSLIEVVISLGLLVAVMTASITLLIGDIKAPQKSEHYILARGLVNEASEAIRAIRYYDWHSLEAGEGQIDIDNNKWRFLSSTEDQEMGKFSRKIIISPVYRDANLNIVEASVPDSFMDALSKNIRVEVYWADNGSAHEVIDDFLISAWPSIVFEQSAWGDSGFVLYDADNVYFSATNTIPTMNSVSLALVSTSTYASTGELESSAILLSSLTDYIAINWEDNIPAFCTSCEVKLQIKTAFDVNDNPGTWSSTWNGPDGEDADESDYFTVSQGEQIIDSKGRDWIKYKLVLTGDGVYTPLVSNVKIFYQ